MICLAPENVRPEPDERMTIGATKDMSLPFIWFALQANDHGTGYAR
jgi:hypothetical protein